MSGTDLELIDDDEEVEFVETPESVASEIAEATAELERLTTGFDVEVPEQTGQALVQTGGSAEQARTHIAAVRAKAMHSRQEVENRVALVRAQQEHVKSLMRKQQQLIEAKLGPLEKLVERLEEGVWMVNLYLGTEERIVTIRGEDFAPADANEPVAIRQLVLYMDEECALYAEQGGLDGSDLEEFDKWVTADPAHLEQVLPERRGVVAIKPRRKVSRRREQMALEDDEKLTYFLIRNGDRLYRTITKFEVGERLVPTATEFGSFFYVEKRVGKGRSAHTIRVPLQPGTLAYERAEEAADTSQRHYMRVGLILQGLVDRTTVFHPQPEGGVNFLDHEHGGKSWRFVADAENLLETSRQPFYEWLAERNAQLQVGMRIVGNWYRYTYKRGEDQWHHRTHPQGAELPPKGVLLTLEERKGGGTFVVRYKRTEPVYSYYGSHEAKVRASCLIDVSDRNFLPFDLVTVEEMEAYLSARGDRHAYEDMFPTLKAAIKAKRAEFATEAPFREMLAGVIARDNGVSVEESAEMVPALVDWFKLTNKWHRPLIGTEAEQTKAVRMIVAEHARRMRDKDAKPEVVETIRSGLPNAILVARMRDGGYVALAAENDRNVFVSEHKFSAKGVEKSVQRWKMMPALTRRARWSVAWMDEARMEEWDFAASPKDHLSDPEMAHALARIARNKNGLVAVAYDPSSKTFASWRHTSDNVIDEARPATGEHEKWKVEQKLYRWTRDADGVTVRDGYRSSWSNRTTARKPWDTSLAPGKRPWSAVFDGDAAVPDPDEATNRYIVLWHDAALDEHVEQQKAEWHEHLKRKRQIDVLTDKLNRQVADAWEKRAEEQAFQKFVSEYLDPGLWEGHRKTLRDNTFAAPFRPNNTTWDKALAHLIEEGGVEAVAGLTVGEVCERGGVESPGADIAILRFGSVEPDDDDDEDLD